MPRPLPPIIATCETCLASVNAGTTDPAKARAELEAPVPSEGWEARVAMPYTQSDEGTAAGGLPLGGVGSDEIDLTA